MVVLRLKRFGRTHRPFYRLCVMDRRSPSRGRAIEELGWFDPLAADGKQVKFNVERIEHWLGRGAQPSDTVRDLLRRNSIDPKPGRRAAAS